MDKHEVYAYLDGLGIKYEVLEHPAVNTIEEMERLGICLDGEVCKNLFLRDDKGRKHFLVVMRKDKTADLAELRNQLGTSRLGFASGDRLLRFLGLKGGEVTVLGVLNDRDNAVEIIFDADLSGHPRLGVHPNDNTATIWISYEDLRRVIESAGHSLRELIIK